MSDYRSHTNISISLKDKRGRPVSDHVRRADPRRQPDLKSPPSTTSSFLINTIQCSLMKFRRTLRITAECHTPKRSRGYGERDLCGSDGNPGRLRRWKAVDSCGYRWKGEALKPACRLDRAPIAGGKQV